MSLNVKKTNSIIQQCNAKRDSASMHRVIPNIGEEINGVKIDGKIGHFEQGGKGNCRLLAMIMGLSYQEWGREGFKNAVRSDNQGGAYVTLFDSEAAYFCENRPDMETKSIYHITNEEILKAKKSQEQKLSEEDNTKINSLYQDYDKKRITEVDFINQIAEIRKKYASKRYSSGDDDVLAVELAVEKAIIDNRTFLNKNFNKPLSQEDKLAISDPLNSKDFRTMRLSHGLLLGDYSGNEAFTRKKSINAVLEFLETNINKNGITAYVSFQNDTTLQFSEFGQDFNPDTSIYNEEVICNHAYAIKGIITDESGVKFVLFGNPHDSSKEMKLPLYTLINESDSIVVSAKQSVIKNEIYKTVSTKEEIDLDSLVKEENDTLQRAFIKENYEEFVKKLIEAPQEEKEAIVNEYFKSFHILSDTQAGYLEERAAFLELMENNIEDLILTLDKAEHGWGKGEAKKALIKPLADNLLEALKIMHGESTFYQDVENRLYNNIQKELDAYFYTNEKNIIKYFKILLSRYRNCIDTQRRKCSK